MNKYLDLVPISAKIHYKQSRMTRICIVLAVFLVAVMFGLADMYLQGLTSQQMHDEGNWHYQFSSLDNEIATLISARPEIIASSWLYTANKKAGYRYKEQAIEMSGQEESEFADIFLNSMMEGSYPVKQNEIAISMALKENYSLNIGDTFPLTLPDGKVKDFTISGVLADNHKPTVENNLNVAMTPESIDAIIDSTNIEKQFFVQLSKFCNMPDVISEIQKQFQLSDQQILSNSSLLSILGQVRGNSVSQIYYVALILSVFVMLTCILMISSSLNSNVAQRTEFFGLMRCLGASPKQIMRFVRCEGLHWCKTAIPIGVAASIVVVWILSAAMRVISFQWFSYMPHWGISWISIGAGAILGVLTVLLAARSPAKRAAKVSPLEAVSGNTQRTVAFRKSANTGNFKIETALGIHHAHTGKRSFILMTASFAVCITLFLTFSTLVNFMENAIMPKPWTPELSIASVNNTCSIESTLLNKVQKNDSVKYAYGRMFTYGVPMVSEEHDQKANLISYDKHQFSWATSSITAGSVDAVQQNENQVLLVDDGTLGINVGDTITLFINNVEQNVIVGGILKDSPLAREDGINTVICSEETFTNLTEQTDFTIIDIQFNRGVTVEDVTEIESLFSDEVVFANKVTQVQQQRNLYYAFSVLVYGFLSIIVAITVFHIMNTINMGVAAKIRQYGAMRAIGMSDRQLIKMIMAEAATYAVSGIVVGCIFGIPMHWVIYVSLITPFWGIPWTIPFIPLGLIVSVILLTTILTVRRPATQLRNLSIVENISSQ